MTTETFTSSGTWTCPAGVTSVQAECWGGGSSGRNSYYYNFDWRFGYAGGGGAYSKSNSISVTPGNNYTVTVGGVAQLSKFVGDASVKCEAVGGTPPSTATPSQFAGAGGLASACTGDVKYSGGDAGNTGGYGGAGGGGGAAAGSSNDGAQGTITAGGVGINGGGSGGNPGYTASPGSAPGGAGGGPRAGEGNTGGAGASGQVILTYTAAAATAKRLFTNFINMAVAIQ